MIPRVLGACMTALVLGACAGGSGLTVPSAWTEHTPPAEGVDALSRAQPVTMSQLDYRALGAPAAVSFRIDAQSPAADLPGGRSFVAAFRIDDLPRPLTITVATQRSAEPGALMGWMPDFRRDVFAPVVHVLDARFNIRQTLQPEGPRAECRTNGFEDVYRVRVPLSEPPDEAAYLVVSTTDALRTQRGVEICGLTRNGLSPTGLVSIAVASLPSTDRIRLMVEATLYEGVRHSADRSLLQGALESSGLLLIGEKGLVFAQRQGLGTASRPYVSRLDLPYEAIASAQVDPGTSWASGRAITLRHVDPVTRQPRWTSLDIAAPVVRGDVIAAIEPHLQRGRLLEEVRFSVSPAAPSLEFVSPGGGVIARVGESAVAGGSITAMPCSLCITGACTPEILVSCAGLFSVGAVVGGVVGGGVELVQQVLGQRPPMPGVRDTLARSAAALPREPIGPEALSACVGEALATPGNGQWAVQGRIAVARLGEPAVTSVIPANSPAGAAEQSPALEREAAGAVIPAGVAHRGRWEARVELARMALVAGGKPGQAPREVPVRLRVEGRLTLVDNGVVQRPLPLLWESEAHPLEQWVGTGTDSRAGRELERACTALATNVVSAVRRVWSE